MIDIIFITFLAVFLSLIVIKEIVLHVKAKREAKNNPPSPIRVSPSGHCDYCGGTEHAARSYDLGLAMGIDKAVEMIYNDNYISSLPGERKRLAEKLRALLPKE